MVAKHQVHKALARIEKLQKFKQRYGIQGDGNTQDARRDLKDDETRPTPQIVCYQYRYFCGTSFQSEEAYAVFLRACYYNLHASMHNISALRSGVFMIADTRGFSWRTFNLKAELRTSEFIIIDFAILNLVLLFRILYSLCRSMLSAKFQRLATFVGPGHSTKAYLDSLGLLDECLPEAWGGLFKQDDFEETVLRRLDERYKNAANFRL